MSSRILNLICQQCSTPVLEYKKSGSGRLIRLYLDNIMGPGEWSRLKNPGQYHRPSHALRVDVDAMLDPEGVSAHRSARRKSDLPRLVCPSCGQLLGHADEHEGRLAYKLIPGALRKANY